jgi:hypothetical protein
LASPWCPAPSWAFQSLAAYRRRSNEIPWRPANSSSFLASKSPLRIPVILNGQTVGT